MKLGMKFRKGKNDKGYKSIRLYVDLIFCLVILPLVLMLVPVEVWFLHNPAFAVTFVLYIYMLYFVYRVVNVPLLFIRKRFKSIAILVVLLLAVTELLTHYPLSDSQASKIPISFRRHLYSQTVWFFFLIVSGFSLAVSLTFELFKQILFRQQVESEKNKAELSLYKAQINPHFMFNTLNTLYGLVVTRSENTESAFIKFSNILQYMYENASVEKIPLKREIEYIEQYIELQKLRLNEHTKVIFENNAGEDANLQIPPMILITFIENAFKYGSSSQEDCTILIRLDVEGNRLCFETTNSIIRVKSADRSPIGIENCRKRLRLLYGRNAELKVENDEEERLFVVKLVINL